MIKRCLFESSDCMLPESVELIVISELVMLGRPLPLGDIAP